MKAIPFTIHEIKGGQVLTILAEQEILHDSQVTEEPVKEINEASEPGESMQDSNS